MEDYEEVDGIEDNFEEQFADELEVLASMSDGESAVSKPKRPKLEAVKKLNFDHTGTDHHDDITPPSSPEEYTRKPENRNSKLFFQNLLDISDMAPLQETPIKPVRTQVLKRPPFMEDYVNVTSSDGIRVFMVLKDDDSGTGVQLQDAEAGWNSQRQLNLLGVPFSTLKDSITQEHHRRVMEECQRLSNQINSQVDHEFSEIDVLEDEESDDEDSSTSRLWVDKFTPMRYTELLSDDYTNRCLLKWLKLWDTVVFGKEKSAQRAKPSVPENRQPFKQQKEQQQKWKTKTQITEEILEADLDQHNRPKFKVALLSGPPGLGKTTLAHIIAKHAGYNVVEMNASDDRSVEAFQKKIDTATQMKSVLGANEKPNCLVIDEIDGAPQAAINVLLNVLNRKDSKESETGTGSKKKKSERLLLRPIICICNDLYVPALRQLRQQAFLLSFPPTLPSRLVQRLCEIARKQGMKADTGALMALCEKTENDIRACVNTLQFLHSRGRKDVSMKDMQTMRFGLKDQNRGLFSVWQEIFQLPRVKRKRIGQELFLPTPALETREDEPVSTGSVAQNAAAQRFYHILHLTTSTGDHEKVTQGLYDNFLNMKFKDPHLISLCLALEWLEFTDHLNQQILHNQNFSLMRYLPFLPVTFHQLFAASSVPRINYPNSQFEFQTKKTQMDNLLTTLFTDISPTIRSNLAPQGLVMEALSLVLEIMSPKMRPVNPQLYSTREKQQLSDLINAMLTYNLTYHQERTADGQYVYLLDPNVEELCHFPNLPPRRQMTYQAKQMIAREIEVEKMRKMEALIQARNSKRNQDENLQVDCNKDESTKVSIKNHQQRLENIVKQASIQDKPAVDFFGRCVIKEKLSSTSTTEPAAESAEQRIGKAVGNSDVWFRFNEGVSNAVRRNVYIRDLL
ncbi:chromosome transmission fidelity protein 18 homolog [Erpetoichthys calabaricus]|uniref:chromosome transmission fidelity protein 18 homolog n=1 Tax=Erpetoichthys calabaricus TaxID=27687 RepID=UPI002234669B|nr:chromosome transmission fidelity protein 18 homolog [Erpetoichthys calabaricus]